MRRSLRVLGAAVIALALGAGTTAAQEYRFDIGLNGGGAYWTDMLDQDQLGTTEDEVRFQPGWLSGAQLTFWPSSRFALRANLGYSERPLELDGEGDIQGTEDTNLLEDINLWSASGDLMIRFGEPNDEWMGREVLPYLALGVGAKIVNPAGEFALTGSEPGEDEGAAFTVGNTTFLLEKDTKLMGLAALGADVRLSPRFALRLEAGDRFFDAPLARLTQDANGNFVRAEGEDEDVGEVTHELYGTIGLHWLMGLQARERVVVAPAPPPPAPAPAPAPAPEPVTETVQVCVIDPDAPAGLRTLQATYYPERGDTLVFIDGEEVMIDRALGDVVVASEADWYIAGRPLVLDVEGRRAEFVTYMGPRQIETNQLAFLGTVNGVPVYANASEAGMIDDRLLELRRTRGTDDLAVVLADDDELRTELEEVQVLYVPLRETGCVFQAVQRVEEVRKSSR